MPKVSESADLNGYAPVAARICAFYERYPDGRIITQLREKSVDEVVFRALVFRYQSDSKPAATGWASERVGDGEINLVACLENTETSAIGRALANLGFTASALRPSVEEMIKVSRVRPREPSPVLRDVQRLLARAEQLGAVRPLRAARWRRLLPGAPDAQLVQLERRLLRRCSRFDG